MATTHKKLVGPGRKRRGSVVVLVCVALVALVGFAALSLDIGFLYSVRSAMQAAADSAALAGVGAMMTDERLKGDAELQAALLAARQSARQFTAANPVWDRTLDVDLNLANAPDGGILLGFLADPTDRTSPLDLLDPSDFNAIRVRLDCDGTVNGAFPLGFGKIFGLEETALHASATAMAQGSIEGFQIPPSGRNPQVLPFALKIEHWQALLDGGATETNDHYSYDPDTGAVSEGADYLPELNLFPGSGGAQLPPGNFGTVDIGAPNNSTADLSRQIRYGISAADLAYLGGQLRIPPDGPLLLNGDTGISAAMKDDLASIIGQGRIIPLFTDVSGNGNNATFSIVSFAGVRIMHVRLTGPMKQKCLMVQPAVVLDEGAIPGSGDSYNVFGQVTLCR